MPTWAEMTVTEREAYLAWLQARPHAAACTCATCAAETGDDDAR